MMMGPTWRLIDTKIGSAHWNMAIDEALLNGFKKGDLPILRLYGWENAVSAGRFSDLGTSLDKKQCEHQKIPIVRRMSGGGVLVHGGDLSYTLILPREWLKESGVKENYHYLCRFLIQLYAKLGHSADFACNQHWGIERSDICLAGIEAYDIMIQGKKMGGNAQRYTRHALFQHGTIPMRLDESLLKPLFKGESGLENAASLERLGTRMTYGLLSSLVREAFCETFAAELIPKALRSSEKEEATALLGNKYTQERWNFHAKPIHP